VQDAEVQTQRRLPSLLLVAGAGALAVAFPVVLVEGRAAKELPWLAGTGIFIAAALLVHRRRPELPVARWFALSAGLVGLVQAADGVLMRATPRLSLEALAWVVAGYQMLSVLGSIALGHLLGLFPDGRPERPGERRLLRALWWLLPVPLVGLFATTTLILPDHHQANGIANPYQLDALAWAGPTIAGVLTALPGVFFVGVVLLVPRYRRADAARRRRIRWLLIPTVFAAGVALTDFIAWRLFPGGSPSLAAELWLTALWIVAIASLPMAIALAVLRPDLLDVDRLIRRSLVYGALWACIAVVYVVAAAGLGMVASRRFPLGLAIALTVGATLLFQPARARLERAADRWVFGTRTDPAHLVTRLGATLEDTVELESLLPRMADTLQEGLGLTWARVRLTPAPAADARASDRTHDHAGDRAHDHAGDRTHDHAGGRTGERAGDRMHDHVRDRTTDHHAGDRADAGRGERAGVDGEEVPALTVPIELDGERLGVVECGPRRQGMLTPDDAALVVTFARQAALAVRNVRLTAELERSRARLVRAQELERRRLERDLHDGVQQDLVALLGHSARVRRELERDADAGAAALDDLQAGLRHVLGELRELAHGIHPSVLSDRGLLEAVESLAARSAVPVAVRADPALRGVRFAQEIEGASYFTVAEALANASKHAAATAIDVTLAHHDGRLDITVCDDGAGFDRATAVGDGLVNLAERLAALGGRLQIETRPGAGTTLTAHLRLADG
jgi:signal transduction histidine kinase